jgi:hypothetical protein
MSSYTRQGHLISLTQANVVADGTNSTFRYTFPQSTTFQSGAQIALVKYIGYNSAFTITAALNNNQFRILWPGPAGTLTYTVTVPDGEYSVSDLNAYIQFFCVQNGLYLLDSGGNYVYYATMTLNVSQYALQITTYVVPTVLPGGYTAPPAWPGFPAVASTPAVVILANNFTLWSGFASGQYPPTLPHASTYSALSTSAPQVDPQPVFSMICSLVQNRLAGNSGQIFSIAKSVGFGQLQITEPSENIYCAIQAGQFSEFTIRLVDVTTGRPMLFRDPNTTILLSIIV